MDKGISDFRNEHRDSTLLEGNNYYQSSLLICSETVCHHYQVLLTKKKTNKIRTGSITNYAGIISGTYRSLSACD